MTANERRATEARDAECEPVGSWDGFEGHDVARAANAAERDRRALLVALREAEERTNEWKRLCCLAGRYPVAMVVRWLKAGSTIRRLRRRWQWERRRAEGLRFIMQRDPAKLLVLAVAERDAARAEVERWSRHAAKRESERDQYVTTALLANQQRDAARAEAAEARAAGWHEALDAVEKWTGRNGEEIRALRSRYPRKEAKG